MHEIKLPNKYNSDWEISFLAQLKDYKKGIILIDCGDWILTCKDIIKLNILCEEVGCKRIKIRSNICETLVSAKSLGNEAELKAPISSEFDEDYEYNLHQTRKNRIFFYEGTLRSGEVFENIGDLFIYGDVNPGAIVSSNGNVMVWGKLLGIAHAGKAGNQHSTISALQLRPVQLRIADKIARGPEEKPEIGLAEKALIESDQIIIKPLKS